MGLPIVQDVELNPGDLVTVEYEIRDTLGFLQDAAIHSVKTELAKDPRFHYQGSKVEDRPDEFGQTERILSITVQVADPSKITGNNPAPPEIQRAGLLPVVGLVAITVLVATALGGYAVVYKSSTVRSIAENPNLTPEERIALANAIKGSGGLSAVFGSLVPIGIIVLVLLVLARTKHT